jgi:dCMP deaminase
MNWHEYYLNQLPQVAAKSKDPSTKVSCIAVSEEHHSLLSTFNGFAIGVKDNIMEVAERYERPLKYSFILHAEQNLVSLAARHGIRLKSCTVYIGWHPCNVCANLLIQAGVRQIVIDGDSKEYNDQRLQERWKESVEIASTLFSEAKVEVLVYHRESK